MSFLLIVGVGLLALIGFAAAQGQRDLSGTFGALALAGNRDKAKSAYEDFLNLWRDADAYLPLLQEAKAERAKLQ